MSEGKHPRGRVADTDEVFEEEAGAAADVPEDEDDTPVEETDPLLRAQSEVDDYKDRWVRLAAEFDNYKKRTARERQALVQSANEALIRALLPIQDSVDRALEHADGETDSESFREGMRMIMEVFPKTLADSGLEEIEAVGKPFDPHDHEALMQVPSAEHEAGIVTDVLERGYRLGNRVVRHAKVVVSLGPPVASEDQNSGDKNE